MLVHVCTLGWGWKWAEKHLKSQTPHPHPPSEPLHWALPSTPSGPPPISRLRPHPSQGDGDLGRQRKGGEAASNLACRSSFIFKPLFHVGFLIWSAHVPPLVSGGGRLSVHPFHLLYRGKKRPCRDRMTSLSETLGGTQRVKMK